MTNPAAITVLDVSHPDWILPAIRALQDMLPDHTIFYDTDERRGGDLVVLAPQPSKNLGIAKDSVKFAKAIGEALTRDMPILLITAGHRALSKRISRVLPPAIRLAPVDADAVLAMLHLRLADGDARWHEQLRTALPSNAMLARLGLDALHAAFRAPNGSDIVAAPAMQADALMPKQGPTLDQVEEDSDAKTIACQIVADLALYAENKLPWSECQHSLLLHSVPGTGKTFLARAIRASSGVPIIMSSLARWQANRHLGDYHKAMIRPSMKRSLRHPASCLSTKSTQRDHATAVKNETTATAARRSTVFSNKSMLCCARRGDLCRRMQ